MRRWTYRGPVTRPRTAPARAAAALVASALLALLALTGCSPDAAPSPTPSPLFASEDEAFAAAEATYRELIALSNEVDTSDPRTFEPLFELSSGDFEASDRKAYSTMHADGISIAGDNKVISFAGLSSAPPYTTVEARACLDVSEVNVTDADGNSVVDPSRPDVYGLRLTFVAEGAQYTVNEAHPETEATC